jgi:hypothetical protein
LAWRHSEPRPFARRQEHGPSMTDARGSVWRQRLRGLAGPGSPHTGS